MTPEIKRLNDGIVEADRHLRSLKNRLEYAVKTCQHVWGTPTYDPIITPGGYDPGDPPGTEENIDESQIDDREMFYIKKFRNEGVKLTNLTDGGEGGKGFTAEINKRAALKRTGLKRSDETKKKLSDLKKGIPLTQSHKDALKKAWETRTPFSPEHYQKISELNRGKINIQKYKLIDPNGVEHITENGLTDFCREYNLTAQVLHKTLSGERLHHKGWKLVEKITT